MNLKTAFEKADKFLGVTVFPESKKVLNGNPKKSNVIEFMSQIKKKVNISIGEKNGLI